MTILWKLIFLVYKNKTMIMSLMTCPVGCPDGILHMLAYVVFILRQGYSKCGLWSRIRTAKGFPVDYQGLPVSAKKAEKRGPCMDPGSLWKLFNVDPRIKSLSTSVLHQYIKHSTNLTILLSSMFWFLSIIFYLYPNLLSGSKQIKWKWNWVVC